MKKNTGFTLVEVMIVVVIIAAIAAIAIPTYGDYIAKSKRADAQGAVLGLAQSMERFFTENNTYCGSENGGVVGTCKKGAPGIFSSQVPTDGGSAYYNLTVDPDTATTFTLTATRTGSMTGDKCGDFIFENTGNRTLNNNTDSVANCWK